VASDPEVKEAVREVREALAQLPTVARFPGTAIAEAAQARNLGEAAADALAAGKMRDAALNAAAAQEAIERTERLLREQGGFVAASDLARAEQALKRARELALRPGSSGPPQGLQERALRERTQGAEARALAERAASGEAPLPEPSIAALKRAAGLMEQAARALEGGDGAGGRELGAQAQRQLEGALPRARQETQGTPTGEGEGHAEGVGKAEVPGSSEDRAKAFRQRVDRGLARDAGGLGAAVRRYAEQLK
jgi:hypothetical protein